LSGFRNSDPEFTGVCEFETAKIRPKMASLMKLAEILTNFTIPVGSWEIFGLCWILIGLGG
jgi:hypothetical protein